MAGYTEYQAQIGVAADYGDYAGTIDICGMKLERGTVPTDWSPAPEDYLGPVNIFNVPTMHRNIFRGQNLGSTFTDAQKAAIAAGTFDDLYLGDYWSINGHTWRIADFDYWYGMGDTSCATHHVVVMPDANLYDGQMHKTESGDWEYGASTTEGGYALSDMRHTGLDKAKTIVTAAFGTNVLNHRIVISNAVKDGHTSGVLWDDSTVELPTERQMFGAPVNTAMNDGVTVPMMSSIDCEQFALMQAVPRFIAPTRQSFWLRDVSSAENFTLVGYQGTPSSTAASLARGVRPSFGVTGL